jgi:hypothetical protein
MLWYKNWLETRLRLLYLLGFSIFFLLSNANRMESTLARQMDSSSAAGRIFLGTLSLFLTVFPLMLAGEGINTKASFRPNRGLHGSTLFTLSMPVSRARLLGVRTALGLIEMLAAFTVVCCVMGAALPTLRAQLNLHDSVEYVLATFICLCGFYCLFVLFAAALQDDMFQVWASIAAILVLRILAATAPFPRSLNIFQAIGSASPLITHTLPWASMGISIGASVIFFLIALKIVQSREY